jgi:photosystem II stability/assembly factor-like uncharacterized protein
MRYKITLIKAGLLILTLMVFTPTAEAQKKRKKANAEPESAYSNDLYSSLEYRLVGPFRGGRSAAVTGVPGEPNLFYFGATGGGIWKTEDGGRTWGNISDGFFGGSIGSIAVAPSDRNVIYAGGGEKTVRGNVSSGYGVWKSVDAGKTWRSMGLEKSRHISRIAIHPKNPDIIYAAVMGNIYKPSEERGVYKSTDGGKNWNKVLFANDQAGAVDLKMDPTNPRIIYASTWRVQRTPYSLSSGGEGSALWKSTDSGETWKEISKNEGFPEGTLGIIGVTVSPVNPERVWAMVENKEKGGLYRSEDGGKKWSRVNEERKLRQRAWYYTRVYADTKDENVVYVLNVRYHKSTDGGKSFTTHNAPHGDHHDLWIDPHNSKRMIIGDDGGAQITYDGGETWTTYHNQPTAQFYRVTTDNNFPYRIYGAQQDNSTVRISHRSSGNSIGEKDWEPTAGGESAHLAVDPKNNDIVYGGTYKGYMMRLDHTLDQTRSTNVWPDNPAGSGVEIMKYRFNWNYPVMFSMHHKNRLYAGSNFLHISTNEGQSWEVISPDLTRGLPETLKSSGGPITQDNTGAEFYSNIFAMAESSLEKGVIYVGSDDGLVHITKDDGKTWKNITPPTQLSPKLNMINCIEPSPFKEGVAYLAATSYKFGDYTPYIYKTNNYGESWTLITNGIKNNHYTRAIRSDKVREGLLYAGTEWGMYISFDDGQHWSSFNLNLPVTSIRDLAVRDNDLIAATHGRSFWMIDDLTPLHQLTEEMAKSDFYLYKPDITYRTQQSSGRSKPNLKLEGENHPNGAIINYYIKDKKETDTIALEILDAKGALIQKYKTTSKADKNDPSATKPLTVVTGGNRFIWDLRYPGFKSFEGMVLYSSPNIGPKAVPGNYKVRLTYNGIASEKEFTIVKDPRLSNTVTDFKNQFDFLIKVRDQVSRANQAIIDIRSVKKDLSYIREKVSGNEELNKIVNEFESALNTVENKIHMTKNQSRQDPLNYGIRINNRLAFLLADSQRGDYPPTDQALAFFQVIKKELDFEINMLNELFEKNINMINNMVLENQIKMISYK